MKRIIILLLIANLFTLKTNSQDFFEANYRVTYKKVNYDSIFNKRFKKEEKRNFYKNYFLKTQNEFIFLLKKTSYKLLFNNNESIFYQTKMLNISDINQKYLENMIGVRGVFYTDKNKILEQKNSYGQDFIIEIPFSKWKITNQTKQIKNFICFKAETIKKIENSRGIHKIPVTAWFAPEIPFNFGPKQYVGLPGLIIELSEDKKTFTLTELINKKELNIEKPIKGKKITLKDFNALSKKMYENRKK